jgi:colanic acid biosynthesis glycosyl transferase WcaI
VRLLVVTPHFAPDTAPTGVVVTALVDEWGRLGHDTHVVTSLPWYREHRVADGWTSRVARRDRHGPATVSRLYPFPVRKTRTARRAAAFGVFSVLAGGAATATRGPFDAVVAVSPPITLAFAGRLAAWRHGCPLVLNVQDVFPDVAVTVGELSSRRLIGLARRMERAAYRAADAVTVVSTDLEANITTKVAGLDCPPVVETIPNFVDTDNLRPLDRLTEYRRENRLGDRMVVMYAGNLGHSQSLDLVVEAARRHRNRDDLVYVINGGGVRAEEITAVAGGLQNLIVIGYQPAERLAEVLATGDIHVVPLRKGLASASVPSKAYSAMAAGRPIIASVDQGTEVARMVADADAGLAVPPDDPDAFTAAVEYLAGDVELRTRMGVNARAWAEKCHSARVAAGAYLDLVGCLTDP